MSRDSIAEIIARAFTDPGFREQLFSDPDKALSEYDLSEEEKSTLYNLEGETFDAFASEVDQRISKSPIVPLPYEISQIHQIFEHLAKDTSNKGDRSDEI